MADVSEAGSGGASGLADYTLLLPTLSDLRETSGPRIDSIPLARLTTSAPRIKKLFFLPPSKCPIDLFGPVSNRTILKRLHVVFVVFRVDDGFTCTSPQLAKKYKG